MTFDEFKILAKGMKAVYASSKFLPDADAIKLFYTMLQDLEYQQCSVAIQKYMMTHKFPPTIAEIREACVTVADAEQTDWLTAWNITCKALSRWGYYRPQEGLQDLQTKDPKAAWVAERLGWQRLCMSENPSADRANFRQAYETAQAREHETALLSPAVREKISMLVSKTAMQQIGDGHEDK